MYKQKLANNTILYNPDNTNKSYVELHENNIIEFDPHRITINTHGFNTKITINRINQVSNMFKLGIEVYRKGSKLLCNIDTSKNTSMYSNTVTKELCDNKLSISKSMIEGR